MLAFVFDAIVFGLTLAIVFGFGPAFITLIQTSINHGFRSAAWFAIGVLANDVLMVTLCVLTSIQVVATGEREMFFFCLAAGIILILLGIFTFIKKPREASGTDDLPVGTDTPRWYVFLGKGFVLNIMNPFVWLFWLGTVAVAMGNMAGDKPRVLLFFAIVLGTNFGFDLLKAKAATFLKRFFNAKRICIMNRVIGCGLMLFGLYFIVRGFVEFVGVQ